MSLRRDDGKGASTRSQSPRRESTWSTPRRWPRPSASTLARPKRRSSAALRPTSRRARACTSSRCLKTAACSTTATTRVRSRWRRRCAYWARSGGKKAAVIGDMARARRAHRARAHGKSEQLHRRARASTLSSQSVHGQNTLQKGTASAQWFGSVDEAMNAVKAAFTAETAMLVKASHSMHFEKIVEELTKA